MTAAIVARRWIVGDVVIEGPLRVPPRLAGHPDEWHVTATDRVIEDTQIKVFTTAGKAQRFIDELTSGKPPVDPLADDPLGPAKTNLLNERAPASTAPTPATLTNRNARMTAAPGEKKIAEASPFNLKAVAEALIGEELDPFVEVSKALKLRRYVRDDKGQHVIDPTTNEPIWTYELDPSTRAKILIELGQYIAPKLKAVEVKVEDKRTLTEDQLNQRITAFLERAAAVPGEAKHIEPPKDAGQ